MPTAEEIAEFQLESDSDDDCMPGGGTWGHTQFRRVFLKIPLSTDIGK